MASILALYLLFYGQHDLMENVIDVMLLGSGAGLLFVLTRRPERLDERMAKSGLHARYHYMIEADPRVIMLFSQDRRMIEINRQGRQWMEGASGDGKATTTLADVLTLLAPDDPEALLARIARRDTVEMKWNERILSGFEWTELFDDQGNSVGSILLFRDVTEDRKFQREYIHSEKLAVVGQLAAATAHEIRNPLTSIKGFLQLLEHRLKGNQHEGEIREYTRIMVEEVDRMEKIIRDFLLMTKPSDAVREPVAINSLLERMLTLVQNQATLRNVHVVTDLRSESSVLMHREAIQQVALNLLQNAFEAMNTGGTLTLQTLEDERYVSFKVIDTGVGMTDEEIANLGSPFYSTKTEGTGLGLTVSSKIIKEHGGRLNVESKKGVGTTITVQLPK
ncbi:MAG: ATP-binding protein [Tumebacillaceae bacterium]